MAFHIHILQSHIRHVLVSADHIGNLRHRSQEFIQLLRGDPQNQAGVSGAASVVIAAVIGAALLHVSPEAFRLFRHGLHQIVKGFRLHIERDIADQLPGALLHPGGRAFAFAPAAGFGFHGLRRSLLHVDIICDISRSILGLLHHHSAGRTAAARRKQNGRSHSRHRKKTAPNLFSFSHKLFLPIFFLFCLLLRIRFGAALLWLSHFLMEQLLDFPEHGLIFPDPFAVSNHAQAFAAHKGLHIAVKSL